MSEFHENEFMWSDFNTNSSLKFSNIRGFFVLDKCSPEGIYLCKNGGMCIFDEAYANIKCLCPYSYGGNYCEKGMDL